MDKIGKLKRSERMIGIRFIKLFGRFDYDVHFNQEGLTILTGPNGYGKSTILKSIEALGKGIEGINFFTNLDFQKLYVFFENQKMVIEKKGTEILVNEVVIKEEVIKYIRIFENIKENSESFNREEFDREEHEEMLSSYYYRKFLWKSKSIKDEEFREERKVFEILKTMSELVGSIYFIKEQRLIKQVINKHDGQTAINVIDELPKKFKKVMNGVQQDYSTIANELDSTYPSRLFEMKEGITEEEYQLKIGEISKKFESLNKYGLSKMQNPGNVVFKKEHATALKIYFEDFEVKYGAYEEFVNKLDLYTGIINNRLTFKSLKISKESGISIVDDKNKTLELEQLSSGEQQEIVLFYDLIFETEKNVLLLIDEPEISLHIVWQKKFMDDLMRIIEYKDFNVIVATHSPQIINNHWDKQVDLGELYGKQLDSE